jgi:hypothetical protein
MTNQFPAVPISLPPLLHGGKSPQHVLEFEQLSPIHAANSATSQPPSSSVPPRPFTPVAQNFQHRQHSRTLAQDPIGKHLSLRFWWQDLEQDGRVQIGLPLICQRDQQGPSRTFQKLQVAAVCRPIAIFSISSHCFSIIRRRTFRSRSLLRGVFRLGIRTPIGAKQQPYPISLIAVQESEIFMLFATA